MNGIMRQRLIALLSAAGLAGTASSSAAQVVKGSEPGDKTQTASTIKSDKNKQENQATKDAAAVKMRKAGGEQQANKDVVTEKVGPDHIVHKHVAGVKYEKSASHADAASKDAAKLTKSTAENSAAKTAGHIKGEKAAANTNAAQNEANKKANQTSPK
jgi:hypothetical protein